MELKELEKLLKGKRVEVFEIFFTFIDEMQSVSWKVEIEGESLSILFNNCGCFQIENISFPLVFDDLELVGCDDVYEIRSKEKDFRLCFEEFDIDPNGGHFMSIC